MEAKQVWYIDVDKMSRKECERLLTALSVIRRYGLKCPNLLKALSSERNRND